MTTTSHRQTSRRWRASLLLLGLTGLLGTGCSGLRYEDDDTLWAESNDRFDSGQYEDSIEYYDEILRRDEEEARALLRRAIAHERTGETSQALRDYARAGELGESRGWLYRANLNIKTGALGEAEQDLTRVRNANLDNRDQVVQLTLVGTLRLKQGQTQMAAQSLERATDLGKGYNDADTRRHLANAHYNASDAYYKLGDFSRAYDHMLSYASTSGPSPTSEQELLEAAPGHLSGRDNFMLGLLAYLNHDYEAAEIHFSRADPDLVDEARKELDDPTLGSGAPAGGVK